jgi:hypothetical protein
LLQDLPKKQCPLEKLLVLNDVKLSIDRDVQKFWEGVQVPRNKLELGADQFISIFLFIIIKAQIPDMFS